jgi:ketosteroid isomerase-like protein
MSPDATTSPAEIADYLAIVRLKNAWAKHYDSGDLDRLMDVFTEDAVLDQGSYGVWTGHAGIREGYRRRMELRRMPKGSMHTICNPVIDIDGDSAVGSWYLINFAFDANGDRPRSLTATVEDEYRKGPDGRWRIARTVVDILWSDFTT